MSKVRSPKFIRGLAAAFIAAVLVAVTAPVAYGAGGDNPGPAAIGSEAGPDVAKKDRWAVINADGTINRGKGVNSVTHTAGSGSYVVHFNKNVRACMFTGTIGLSGAVGTSARGFLTTVGAAIDVNGVFVTTDDINGASAERGFHLYVGC